MESAVQATATPIRTDAEMWPVVVVSLGDTVSERTEFESDRPRLSPDGRPTYSTGCVLRLVTKAGEIRSDKNASISVIEPPQDGVYETGEVLCADGAIFVQPFTPGSSNFGTFSITVERLVPVTEPASKRPSGKGSADG